MFSDFIGNHWRESCQNLFECLGKFVFCQRQKEPLCKLAVEHAIIGDQKDVCMCLGLSVFTQLIKLVHNGVFFLACEDFLGRLYDSLLACTFLGSGDQLVHANSTL